MIADKVHRPHLMDSGLSAHLPEHVGAAIELLEGVMNALRGGVAPEDIGRRVELVGIMMQRRT